VGELQDHRSPVSVAAAWASQVTSIALEMVVPPVLGWWLDQKLGTSFVFVTVGGIFGFCAGMLSLLHVARVSQGWKGDRDRKHCTPSSKRGQE
jgi:F0F1-type ATP synthase assembly protein I